MVVSISLLLLSALLLNILFGYYRQGVPKYSLRWFLAIHMPVPLVYLVRVLEHLDILLIPISLAVSAFGQILGGKIRIYCLERSQVIVK